jgi:hypothetical protein
LRGHACGNIIVDTRTYDDGGRLAKRAYNHGVTTTYAYRVSGSDKDNVLAPIAFTHPGGTATNRQVVDLTHDWDANMNKTKETIVGTASGYSFDTTLGTDPDGYDDENRLTYLKRRNHANLQTRTLFRTANSIPKSADQIFLLHASLRSRKIQEDAQRNSVDGPEHCTQLMAQTARRNFGSKTRA